ncbi:hypothetical protein LOD99_15723 [Oopsacas minuta]|uniref:Protein-serine/threonine phosphatase n=1 Tax=Oopsacas minuta TaxID=111878 RepID=A0AAV7K9Y5_9METZ|nr:hypothetical protein LOD99_15723 [Oopsacas minuta]
MTQSLPAGLGCYASRTNPNLSGIEAEILSSILSSTTPVIVIDIRPFCNYTQNHIINAVNIASTSLIQRRLKKGIISPLDLIKESKMQCRDVSEIKSAIICHTEKGMKDFENPTSFATILVEKLLSIFGDNTHYLQGGFESFSSMFPHLCTSCRTLCTVSSVVKAEYSLPEPARITNPISRITETLYISGREDATNLRVLQANGITHIINMTTDIPNNFSENKIHYLSLPAMDSHRQSLKEFFKLAFAFIDAAKTKQGRVLIHCHAGVSRSSTMVIAYLMWSRQWRFEGTIQFVKLQRPCIDPNIGFIGQLMEFDNCLYGDIPCVQPQTLETTLTTGASSSQPWEFTP